MPSRALVLDANILIRAVLGQRVRRILEAHADSISFFVPEPAYEEAEQHLAALVVKRGGDPTQALATLRSMAALGTVVSQDLYGDFEAEVRKRLGARDPDDCPIWTEAPTSLAVASRPGPPPASTASSRISTPAPFGFTHRLTANHGSVDVAGTASEPGQRPSAWTVWPAIAPEPNAPHQDKRGSEASDFGSKTCAV